MKAVILAGGLGTRLSEETGVKPKPMVEIGGAPMIWHIMKIYSAFGVNDFVICCGYRGHVIKEYFANYYLHRSDVTFDVANRSMSINRTRCEPWRVTLVDTGWTTMTGGRLKRVEQYLDSTFFLTYGDGVSDVNLDKLLAFHREQGAVATLTAVQPPGRFGAFTLTEGQNHIERFREKPEAEGNDAWINAGFFALEPEIFQYIEGDQTVWEQDPLRQLAQDHKLAAFRHKGFWQPMDTLHDRMLLENLWRTKHAPWKIWAPASGPQHETGGFEVPI